MICIKIEKERSVMRYNAMNNLYKQLNKLVVIKYKIIILFEYIYDDITCLYLFKNSKCMTYGVK